MSHAQPHRMIGVLLWAALLVLLAGFVAQAVAGQRAVTANPGFTCAGGAPAGQLLMSSSCSGSPGDGKVFSYFVCKYEEVLNEILSKVYCKVVFEATPSVKAALTLFVSLCGVAFLMGLLPFTAKELAVIAIKFSLVLAFATQAEYMIGYGYALFVALAKEGIVIVLDYLLSSTSAGAGAQSTNDVYGIFDKALQELIGGATQNEGENAPNPCQNSIFAMMVIVAAAVPPMAFIGGYFLFRILYMVLRAVFGYCQGLLGITFLTVLSPIYVSFALFKPTRPLFDKWVQYLISFGLQMVIVFAFIGMLFYILDRVSEDFQDYMQLVKPYDQTVESEPGVFNPISGCGICEMNEVGYHDKPSCKSEKVTPITEMSKNKEFMQFASMKAMALIVLFYVLDIMIGFVPELARHLAGPKHAPLLGGGQMPGEKAIGGALAAGSRAFLGSGNSASGLINGLSAAGRHALTADGGVLDTAIRSVANPNDPHRSLGSMDNSPANTLIGAAMGLTGAAVVLRNLGGTGSPAPAARGAGTSASSSASSGAQSSQDAAVLTRGGTAPSFVAGSRSGSQGISGSSGEDALEGSAGRDTLGLNKPPRDVSRNDLEVAQTPLTFNAGLADQISRTMSKLGENPSQQEMAMAMAGITASADELKAAVHNINTGELSARVMRFLKSNYG